MLTKPFRTSSKDGSPTRALEVLLATLRSKNISFEITEESHVLIIFFLRFETCAYVPITVVLSQAIRT